MENKIKDFEEDVKLLAMQYWDGADCDIYSASHCDEKSNRIYFIHIKKQS